MSAAAPRMAASSPCRRFRRAWPESSEPAAGLTRTHRSRRQRPSRDLRWRIRQRVRCRRDEPIGHRTALSGALLAGAGALWGSGQRERAQLHCTRPCSVTRPSESAARRCGQTSRSAMGVRPFPRRTTQKSSSIRLTLTGWSSGRSRAHATGYQCWFQSKRRYAAVDEAAGAGERVLRLSVSR